MTPALFKCAACQMWKRTSTSSSPSRGVCKFCFHTARDPRDTIEQRILAKDAAGETLTALEYCIARALFEDPTTC